MTFRDVWGLKDTTVLLLLLLWLLIFKNKGLWVPIIWTFAIQQVFRNGLNSGKEAGLYYPPGNWTPILFPRVSLSLANLSMLQTLHCFANHLPRTRIIIYGGGWASALQVPAVSACLPGFPGIACSCILLILLLSSSKCVSFEAVRA